MTERKQKLDEVFALLKRAQDAVWDLELFYGKLLGIAEDSCSNDYDELKSALDNLEDLRCGIDVDLETIGRIDANIVFDGEFEY